MRSLIVEAVVWSIILMGVLVWGIDHGKKQGIAEGQSQALKRNPPSQELEDACLGLWIGEQNKKAWKKENDSKR